MQTVGNCEMSVEKTCELGNLYKAFWGYQISVFGFMVIATKVHYRSQLSIFAKRSIFIIFQ